MTRINIVPVKELCNKHLFAEYREMPRLVKNLHTALNRRSIPFKLIEIAPKYILGKGHVKFFFNKFKYLHFRHIQLTEELLYRGYNLSNTDSSIFSTVDKMWYGDYSPSEEEMKINRHRIRERMPDNPKWSIK